MCRTILQNQCYSILVLVFIITLCETQETNLCSLSKMDNKCRCEYRTCEVTHFPELYADCRWIELEDFPQNNQLPEEIKHLDLSHNNIVTLRKEFSSKILIDLILSYNELDYIDFGFFENFPNLKILDLSHNSFKKLNSDTFNGVTQLTMLDLSYNELATLPPNLFTPIQSLSILNLAYNTILGQIFEKIPNIFEEDFNLNQNISNLNLNKLNLTKISNDFFGDSTNLQYLNLGDNLFDDIPPIPTSVTNFDFSGNNITTLSVKHLQYRDLTILRLNRMQNLENIADYAFYNMENLQELYMDNCPKLRAFNDLAFGVIRSNPDDIKLQKLSLARNGLQRLNETYVHLFKNLEYINLQNNPWICDCRIKWVQIFGQSFYKNENMRCAQPANLKDTEIMELTLQHLPDCSVSSHVYQLRKILIPILAAIVMILMIVVVCQVYFGPYMHNKYHNVRPLETPNRRPESPEKREETFVY